MLPPVANKPRALLTLLLLRRGEAVSPERLVDDLWGERPPASAAKSLQVYISQLRKLLGDGVLETRGRSYALVVEPDRIDAVRFERMLELGIARLAEGRARDAAAVLSEALSLWRGPPLADFTYESWAQAEIARLENLRLVGIEERIEADLALAPGHEGSLIAELEGLVALHPTRERLAGQLMLALYRSGRQTEALDVVRTLRRRLVDELGIQPGPALRELESRILRQDPDLEGPRRLAGPSSRGRRRRGALVALGAAAVILAGAVALGGESDEPVAASLEPVSHSICSPLAYAPGAQPEHIVISDQELKGPNRVLGTQVTAAVEFVIRERRFTAGPHSIAFQACDSRTQTEEGGDCEVKAKQYAAHAPVLGVIGPLISNCAEQVIPVANAARPGALAVVSPSNTRVSLTRSGAGAPPGERPDRHYPTGVRNYVRVIAADDFQVAANAMLAQRLGVRRAFVMFDRYSETNARSFVTAAEQLGLGVAGTAPWERTRYASLAARVRTSRADGVFLAGALVSDGARVVRALRRKIGREIPILATDGFSVPELVADVGPASEGMRISVPGVDPQGVTGSGRELVDRLREAVGEPHPYTVSAAQATHLLLDAIGRSDGTRRSVISELFSSEIRDGVLGDFSVTPAGDTTANQVTIYRIESGERRFDQVLTPPLSLVVTG